MKKPPACGDVFRNYLTHLSLATIFAMHKTLEGIPEKANHYEAVEDEIKSRIRQAVEYSEGTTHEQKTQDN